MDKYLTLFNNMQQGFCIVEMIFDEKGKAIDYRFLENNPAFDQQMRNLPGNHWLDIHDKVVKANKPVHVESHNAGTWYDIYAFPFEAGSANQIAMSCTNITQRKNSEEALR